MPVVDLVIQCHSWLGTLSGGAIFWPFTLATSLTFEGMMSCKATWWGALPLGDGAAERAPPLRKERSEQEENLKVK